MQGVEKYQIAGPEVIPGNGPAVPADVAGAAPQFDGEALREHQAHESAAVQPFRGVVAATPIGHAQQRQRAVEKRGHRCRIPMGARFRVRGQGAGAGHDQQEGNEGVAERHAARKLAATAGAVNAGPVTARDRAAKSQTGRPFPRRGRRRDPV